MTLQAICQTTNAQKFQSAKFRLPQFFIKTFQQIYTRALGFTHVVSSSDLTSNIWMILIKGYTQLRILTDDAI